MRVISGALLLAALPSAVLAKRVETGNLPNAQQLKPLVLAGLRHSKKNLENYSCLVRTESQEFRSDGSVKKTETKLEERFYVNGVPIGHLLSKEGRQLSAVEAKKEQGRVDYEVKKYSNAKEAAKRHEEGEQQVEMFLRAQRLLNGRRVMRDGRSTLLYDLEGDPNFRPKKIEERFAQALSGKLWLDEHSSMPVEMRADTAKDIKIGGGLIASLHKGFQLHLLLQRQPDDTWLVKRVEGNGEARAALFLHPRFHFREEISDCHLFSVQTEQKIANPMPSENRNQQPQ